MSIIGGALLGLLAGSKTAQKIFDPYDTPSIKAALDRVEQRARGFLASRTPEQMEAYRTDSELFMRDNAAWNMENGF